MLRVVSLGAGVQSTALLMKASEGYFGKVPDAAIFADTAWEPQSVYTHLDVLERMVGIPIYRVSAGNIRSDALSTEHNFASMPLYVKDNSGKKQQLRRQCTREYKVAPIRRQIRKLLGDVLLNPGSCELWLGISLDEATRMKPSPVKYINHRYPLIEANLTRYACESINAEYGLAPVKSACIGCPYTDNMRWQDMKRNDAESWQDAVDFDKSIRKLRGRYGTAYLHRNAVPLEEVKSEEDMGQLNMFDAECEGMCGV